MTIHALFKFGPNPYGGIEIDTTSNLGIYRELSPFILRVTEPSGMSVIFENLWQFSKVYRDHIDFEGNPNAIWYDWRIKGWRNPKAIRYPKGKGASPEYSYWDGHKLGYIDARKQIYAPIYAEFVQRTSSFKRLEELYNTSRQDIILRDYDAYDHLKLSMTLKDVINNPNRKMGHAFVLIMILTGTLRECLKS